MNAAEVSGRRARGHMPGALLAVTVLLLLLALLGFQLWLSYQDKVTTAEVSARNLAAIYEARIEATLRRSDADLRALAGEIPLAALKRQTVARHARAINAALSARLFNMQEAVSYRVHGADGEVLYSSDKAGTPRVNIADQAYFRLLRDDATAGTMSCEVASGRSFGRQVLVTVRALRDERGEFRGVVHGMIELDYFRRQFESINLGAQGFIVLRRRDDHSQVLRWPEVDGPANAPLPPAHPVAQRLAGGAGSVTLHYASSADPVRRIVGIEVMPNYPFYLAVGLNRDEVLAGWRQQASIVGISTLLLLALFGTLLVRLWRMRDREAAMVATLTRSEAQYRTLAEMVPVGISHIDTDGRYTYVNERALEITGRRRDELLGSHWLTPYRREDWAAIEKAWAERRTASDAFVWEYRYVRRSGRSIDVMGEVRTEFDAQGRVRGYVVAQTDITPRKEAEAELLAAKQLAESANQAKTRFLAAASHDLRQPIQAINLFRDALGRTELSPEQQTLSNLLAVSVHSLGELLYSLLDISKLESGQFRPQLCAVGIDPLFDALDADFSPLALRKGLRFKLYSPSSGLQLMTDSGILLSVLRNLIDNAFKYTESGGILVGVRRRSGCALIQVFDTGIGIDPAYGEQLFAECFQVNSSAHDRSKGLGLGLSIARRMAQLLGGEVSFRSRPGVGTVFALSLPLACAAAADAAATRPAGDAAHDAAEDAALSLRVRGRKVVVVEDDPIVAKSIEVALSRQEVHVVRFASAESALASPHVADADFILSDYTLPGRDGLQLLECLAARSHRPIRAALMTGETSSEALRLMRASRWKVLVKPVGLAAVLGTLAGGL